MSQENSTHSFKALPKFDAKDYTSWKIRAKAMLAYSHCRGAAFPEAPDDDDQQEQRDNLKAQFVVDAPREYEESTGTTGQTTSVKVDSHVYAARMKPYADKCDAQLLLLESKLLRRTRERRMTAASLLISSMSSTEVSLLTSMEVDIDDPIKIIAGLDSYYQRRTFGSKLALLQKLFSFKLTDQDLTAINKTCQDLSGLGRTVTPEDKLAILINGLPEPYNTFKAIVEVEDIGTVVSEATFSNYVAKLRNFHVSNKLAGAGKKKPAEDSALALMFNEKFKSLESQLQSLNSKKQKLESKPKGKNNQQKPKGERGDKYCNQDAVPQSATVLEASPGARTCC